MPVDKQLYINGQWVAGKGPLLNSQNPATGEIIWLGHTASSTDVDAAVAAAREAFKSWGNLPYPTRKNLIQAFATLLKAEKMEMAEAISIETGKPLWESIEETNAMINKVDISIEAHEKRAALVSREQPNAMSMTRFRPHGVIAVLGPFNLPGHLPNGHIVPALLAGNTVVFKPSEQTPFVAQQMMRLWEYAGLPAGVLNLVQGGSESGQCIALHPGLDGLFFTGSWKTGRWLSENLAAHPEKILALEMGGNNPLVVTDVSDIMAAAFTTVQSAYLTSGQRCTCARRLIVPKGKTGDNFVKLLENMIGGIRIGPYTSAQVPYMGPLINPEAARNMLEHQRWLIQHGAIAMVPMRQLREGSAFLTPGLLDVTPMTERLDEELFGPLLQLIRVNDYDAAIVEANRTIYGLSAGLISDSRLEYEEFHKRIKAGLINWNTPLTGASSMAPFGGVGISGNHRPSAYYAVDYCNYPVASLERSKVALPSTIPPGLEFKQQAWV